MNPQPVSLAGLVERTQTVLDEHRYAFMPHQCEGPIMTPTVYNGIGSCLCGWISDVVEFESSGKGSAMDKLIHGKSEKSYQQWIGHVADELSTLLAQHAVAEPQVCEKTMHMYVWTRQPRFVAVAQAENVERAREILLEEIETSRDGSCPEREAADKWVRENTPSIWHQRNAEFALTDSAELREQEDYSNKLQKKLDELKAAHAAEQPKLTEEQVREISGVANELNHVAAQVMTVSPPLAVHLEAIQISMECSADRLTHLLTSPVAPPPQLGHCDSEQNHIPHIKGWGCLNWRPANTTPVAPGEQPLDKRMVPPITQKSAASGGNMEAQYQIQIVLVKRTGTDPYSFKEVMRTDPVYIANVDESGHAEAVVATIERYGNSL